MTDTNDAPSGDETFKKAWDDRVSGETGYLHWTRGAPETQVQLAFRSHWLLFQELLAAEPPKGKRCVELGAGRGTASMYFADAGWDCTLVDISDTVLKQAERTFEAHGLSATTVVGDALDTGLESGGYDVCLSIGLLEHLPDLKGALAEQVRLLAPGGLLLAYVVPENDPEAQHGWDWLNDILRSYYLTTHDLPKAAVEKPEVYRDSADIAAYRSILAEMPVRAVGASGTYPLPMLSPSISFPFTLNPADVERRLTEHFSEILAARAAETGRNPWLCDERYGQSFLVWATKTDGE